MPNSDAEICREYEELVFSRGSDPRNTLVPKDHAIDWDDQPSRFKFYRGVSRLPLSEAIPPDLASLSALAGKKAGLGAGDARELSFEEISILLRLTNGVLRRKLDINWNLDHDGRGHQAHSVFARPSSSGGGMYPFELYLATARGRSLPPGLYHYDAGHHALERLHAGDAGGRIRAALCGGDARADAAYFVLISLNFWKNYFKYHNFCYHVVTQDLGAAFGTLRTVALALGVEPSLDLWFKDEALNRTLGLETDSESVFAVVSLGNVPAAPGQDAPPADEDKPLVNKSSYQRSKRVFPLPLVARVHRSALLDGEPPPPPASVARAHCEQLVTTRGRIDLPAPSPELMSKDLRQVFLDRSSSWGKMTSHPPLELEKVASVARYVTGQQDYVCDIRRGARRTRFTRLMLFVNHVQGVPPGVYSYDPEEDCLWTVREEVVSVELQRRYFLPNYNLEQASLVFAIVGSTERMLKTFGNRGLRILHAEVGQVAQHIYLSTAALSIGCGAVLGFDNIALNRLLGLEGTDQNSLLILLAGRQRNERGSFDYRLV
jgi:SagB-type dehydrogenase family enzyme